MLTPWIAPSILSADFARLGDEVRSVLDAGADVVHFDVMDNHYVPNLTIGPLVCEALRKHGITAPIDVHLMVKPVDRIIPDFAKAGASWISFHPEASDHVDRTLGLIREHGCRPGQLPYGDRRERHGLIQLHGRLGGAARSGGKHPTGVLAVREVRPVHLRAGHWRWGPARHTPPRH